jgi:HEPN domain-containing protein
VTLLDEWVEKAEGDYRGAVALNRRRKQPLPDLVCYHCQQSAEKYLKAYLVMQGVTPPRTHNLLDLLADCEIYDSTLSSQFPLVVSLDPFSVQFHYPGSSATVANAQNAVLTLRRLRKVLRKKLGL